MNKINLLKEFIKSILSEQLNKKYDHIEYDNLKIFHTHSSILNVYDFDDTLAFTKEEVFIRDKKGNLIKKLSPSEYAVYEKGSDEISDYQDFKYVNNADPNNNIINRFKISLSNPHTRESTYILTARGLEAGKWIHNFLIKNKIYLEDEHIITLDSNNPLDKSNWIKNKMVELNIPKVYFWDDSVRNVNAVRNLKDDLELNKIFGKDLFIISKHVKKH